MLRFRFKKIKWRQSAILVLFANILLLPTLSNCQGYRQPNQPNGYPNINPDRLKIAAMRTIKAKELLSYLNPEADPCKDFFDFACGKWSENHVPTRVGEIITPQSELEMRVNKNLQLLLNEASKLRSLDERKVSNFYQSCIAVESTSPAQQQFMLGFIKQLGGIPSIPSTNWNNNYDWLGAIIALRARLGLDVLISFEIGTIEDTMRQILYLGEPQTTIIPAENCSAVAMETMDIRSESYESLQEEVAENMRNWLRMSESDAKRFAGDVVSFEFKLCKKMRMEQSSSPEDMEDNEFSQNSRRNQINSQGQKRLYGDRREEVPNYGLSQFNQFQNIDFNRYVQSVLGNTYNERVYVRSMEYLKHLDYTIARSQKATIANYLMYRTLFALNFPSYDNSTNRPIYCIRQVQNLFPRISGYLYNRYNQQNNLVQEVGEYFEDIKNSVLESLEQADWIDRRSKTVAQQKLNPFNLQFPIRYENLEANDLRIEAMDYWNKLVAIIQYNTRKKITNPKPEAIESYDVATKLTRNDVLVGGALLQPPLYNRFYARAMNYASLGQSMARELALAFDEQFWREKSDEYTLEGVKNQTECFRSQYSNYLYNSPDVFRNTTKLREIIADSSGLNVAFKAYLGWLGTMHPKTLDPQTHETLRSETLKTVDFSNTQLFFIHFAQSHCSIKYGEETPSELFPLDKHTPERYLVNGPLSNSEEFAREFNCRPGDVMNPGDKCVIF